MNINHQSLLSCLVNSKRTKYLKVIFLFQYNPKIAYKTAQEVAKKVVEGF